MTNIETKKVLITGVSSGLGRALAQKILERGGCVAGTLRDKSQMSEFEALAPGRAVAVEMDITNPEQVKVGVEKAITTFGQIDVLANNAGHGLVGAIEETSDLEAQRMLDTNFLGNLRVTRAILPQMRQQKSGHIINYSAIGGFTGFPGLGVYSAAKAAVDIMGEALAAEVKPLGINVTILTVGIFRTDFAGRSLQHTEQVLDDYQETPAGKFRGFIDNLSGNQPNDPELAAEAIIKLIESDKPPLHLALGNDAIKTIQDKIERLQQDVRAWQEVSASTAY
ncbi:oxidoreductase [Pleurocapsa sp. PCC 7319]|uniref:oxidoreductase n=1 Tax=Pleurocapsa sp. PCC 7319 TaxID=118161 RepID=UPI0003465B70|nr:oxidoreductase [Pleurocapsa sp. PCC 7319]